jgi:PQQ-like domain
MTRPRTQPGKGLRVLGVAGSLAALVLATVPAGGQALAGQLAPAGGPAGTSAGTGSGLGFTVNSAVGTAQGPALTAAMPGPAGGYARLNALGTVGLAAPDGRTLWQRSTDSLYADWQVRFWGARQSAPPAPEVPTEIDPVNPAVPQLMGTGANQGDANVHPVAAGYLAGSRVPVVAVAETVGVGFGSNSLSPFSVPGSWLHYGTFVSVLNGRTGQTIYHELDPGYVPQLAITGGRLVIADETGYPQSSQLPLGAWRSVSTVRALSFRADGGGLSASTAWSFTTHAPWAAVLGLQPADGDLAVTWSDTPEDLGVPGPPDGHVVLLGPDGTVRWEVATPGYPVLSGYDAYHRLLVVAEQTDPTLGIGYTLAGLRPGDGSAAVSMRIGGVLPTAMSVAGGTWYTAGLVTTVRQLGNGGFTAGRVNAVDPVSRRVLWSTDLTGTAHDIPVPETVLASGAFWRGQDVVVGSNMGTPKPTPAFPHAMNENVRVLSGATGQTLWNRSGAVPDPPSLMLSGAPWAPQVTGVTDDEDAVSYSLRTGQVQATTPLFGEVNTAVPARIGGRPVIIAGTQSGGVYALDAGDLSDVLWSSYAGGGVHQITLATAGSPEGAALVVAATNRVDVMDLDTGRIQLSRDFPGQFVWNAAVGTIGGDRSAVVVATDRLTAFDAGTGRLLWTYHAPVPAYFSNPAIVDGTTVAEYQNQVNGEHPATTMAAVGIGPSGRASWTAPASTSDSTEAELDNGVFASPVIPGAGATGVALDWIGSGSGRVDVRNALTGALLYTNRGPNLNSLQGWAIDPRLGLVAMGYADGELIQPGHPIADQMAGSGAAFVHVAGRAVLVVGAAYMLQAYPAAELKTNGGKLAASDTTYASGTVLPAGPPSTGQVLSMPTDSIVQSLVQGTEVGLPSGGRMDGLPIAEGLTLATLASTQASAATAPRQAAAPKPATRARLTEVSAGAPRPGLGLITPRFEVKVRGYTKAGRPVLSAATPAGYDPATIGRYLHLTGDGAGQTVAVVDAYADPRITADVNTFSGQFGLPKVCGSTGAGPGCFHFTIKAPQGQPGSNAGWAVETSLDIEWIHAIAPKAAVVLVEARSQTFDQAFEAVTSAAALRPDAVSMSWGLAGEFSGESYYDGRCALAHSVCVVAAGDSGFPGGYPAYDPNVIAVGGTTLQLASNGAVSSETDWNGSGGGQSFFEAKPPAQQGVTPGQYRGIPDVSFDADPDTGVAVYDSVPYLGSKGWLVIGGTSVGAPAWSAILATADQVRAAAGKPRLTAAGDGAARAIYAVSTGLAPVTSGPPNGICPVECQPGPGYDFITGLGSPRAGIDQALAAAP